MRHGLVWCGTAGQPPAGLQPACGRPAAGLRPAPEIRKSRAASHGNVIWGFEFGIQMWDLDLEFAFGIGICIWNLDLDLEFGFNWLTSRKSIMKPPFRVFLRQTL